MINELETRQLRFPSPLLSSNSPLCASTRSTKNFHKKGGIIYKLASQTRTPFERHGGRYELAMTLPPGKEEDEGASARNCQAASFRRPEK